jgi:lipoprotein NlpD
MPVFRPFLCLSVLLLSACIDPQVGVRRNGGNSAARVNVEANRGGEHRVQKGETLYAIAFKYALDFRDIARWNNIAEPFTIYPSQRLKLSDPTRMPTLEASAPRPAPATSAVAIAPVPNATSVTATSASSVAPTVGAGVPVESSSGVTVGTVAQAPAMVSTQPLSPSNSEGLPTGFTEAGAASASSANTPTAGASATAIATTSSGTAASNTAVNTTVSSPAAVTNPATASNPAALSNPIVNEAEIAAPATSTAKPVAGANGWGWPVQGKLIGTFASTDPARQGIDIAGNLGDPVHAAKAGEVVYSGRGIIGYGELIVIKHDDATLTAYGHNRKRLVKEGQRVTQGQAVAEMGKDTQGRALLHFELRRNGKPVDPLGVLPARR